MKKLLFAILAVFLIIPTANAADMETDEGYIARGQFTSEVSDREPANEVNSVKVGEQIVFFTDIRNMEGKTVTHRWVQEGEELFSMNFNIGGNRWRVWTTKNIYDWNVGDMQVIVEDEDGKVLSQKTIAVVE